MKAQEDYADELYDKMWKCSEDFMNCVTNHPHHGITAEQKDLVNRHYKDIYRRMMVIIEGMFVTVANMGEEDLEAWLDDVIDKPESYIKRQPLHTWLGERNGRID